MTIFDNEKKYDWKKGLQKLLRSALIVGLTGFIAVYYNDPRFLVIIPVVEYILNYIKNSDNIVPTGMKRML